VRRCRPLGAPVVFSLRNDKLQWWKCNREKPELFQEVEPRRAQNLFQEHQAELAPRRIYAAKTLGRVNHDRQLGFVDVGLMPLIEEEAGRALSGLITRVVEHMVDELGLRRDAAQHDQEVFRSAFWLLAAKILRDKAVPSFKTLDLQDPRDVFSRVGRHYGVPSGLPPTGGRWRSALARAAQEVAQFGHVGNVSTEAMAYLYENTLVSKELRKQLGTHSTPSYLVDYIVWQLAPWIEAIAPEERRVFEPACGHAAFLVSAMRLLRELEVDRDARGRGLDIRKRLHGIDIDAFALEIARLSLTLADIPNPNGWNLEEEDIFEPGVLSKGASRAKVLLVNPPFENFTAEERARYGKRGAAPTHRNKATQVLSQALETLPDGAVFGVVVPQGFLHNRDSTDVRRLLTRRFELQEICLFPDKIFEFSDMESAILVGRRRESGIRPEGTLQYRRVREPDAGQFRETYRVSSSVMVRQARFTGDNTWVMRVPDLEEVWQACQGFPSLCEIAEVGQGFQFKGRGLPRDDVTITERRSRGLIPGFAKVPRGLMIHLCPPTVWVNLAAEVIRRPIAGTVTGQPQVLLNYAPVGRGPWRLKAIIDREGHAATSSFLAIRPNNAGVPLEFLWAILNAPFANAFVYALSMKRHILAGEVRRMPVPPASEGDMRRVADAAEAYLKTATASGQPLSPEPSQAELKTLMLHVDAEVLHLYDLPPRLERQLLDVFAGYRRPGVPFVFDRYYPDDYAPYVPLHVYLSEEYQRSAVDEVRRRWEPLKPGPVLEALVNAVEAFGEE
jgi:hypothetical protein